MKKIKSAQAMFPSFSGAYRLRIIFFDNTERHCYMMPDGSLFIPPNHKDPDMLLNPVRATKEWEWVVAEWPKNNNGAKLLNWFEKDTFSKIVRLAQKFENPNYYPNKLQQKLEKEAQKPILKNAFADEFKKIRRNINNELQEQPAAKPANAHGTTKQTGSVQQKPGTKKEAGGQIAKFFGKFGENWRRTNQSNGQQQATA